MQILQAVIMRARAPCNAPTARTDVELRLGMAGGTQEPARRRDGHSGTRNTISPGTSPPTVSPMCCTPSNK